MIDIETLIFTDPDFDEAYSLLRNAAEFRPKPEQLDDQNIVMHHVAIGLELAFKAALTAAGMKAAYRRFVIGHDLAAAARWSMRVGVRPAPLAERVLAALHPHYGRGGFQREPIREWPAELIGHARFALDFTIEEAAAGIVAREPGPAPEDFNAAFERLEKEDQSILLLLLDGESLSDVARGRGVPIEAVEKLFAQALLKLDDHLKDIARGRYNRLI